MSIVRQSPIQGDSQVDWIWFMSDVLAIELHTYAHEKPCVVKIKKKHTQNSVSGTHGRRRHLLRNAATATLSRSSLSVSSRAVKVRS